MRKKFTREFPSEASTERLRKGFMRYLGQKVILNATWVLRIIQIMLVHPGDFSRF